MLAEAIIRSRAWAFHRVWVYFRVVVYDDDDGGGVCEVGAHVLLLQICRLPDI